MTALRLLAPLNVLHEYACGALRYQNLCIIHARLSSRNLFLRASGPQKKASSPEGT